MMNNRIENWIAAIEEKLASYPEIMKASREGKEVDFIIFTSDEEEHHIKKVPSLVNQCVTVDEFTLLPNNMMNVRNKTLRHYWFKIDGQWRMNKALRELYDAVKKRRRWNGYALVSASEGSSTTVVQDFKYVIPIWGDLVLIKSKERYAFLKGPAMEQNHIMAIVK